MANKVSLPIAILAIGISIFSFFYFHFSSNTLVYVDVNRLIQGYKRTAIVQKQFEAKAKELNTGVDSLMSDWQEELKKYEKERSSMTKKELELKQELLSNKQQKINNYRQAIQKKIQEEDQKTSQTIINDINDFVKEYGESHGYKIIFGASGNGNVMYADESTDLTKKVLKELNKDFNGEK